MSQEMLLKLINGQMWVPLGLHLINSVLSTVILLKLGLRILKTDKQLRTLMTGTLLIGSFNILVKPFLTLGLIEFLLPIILLDLALMYYSKTQIIICTWVSFLLMISTTLGPLLVITPLASTNPVAKALFFDNPYGTLITILLETSGPAVLLMMLTLFRFELIPSPGKLLKPFDFWDIYLFLGVVYWCFRSSVNLFIAAQQGNRLTSIWPIIDWLVSGSLGVAYYFRKVRDQKKYERLNKAHEIEQAELMTKYEEKQAELISEYEERQAEMKAHIEELATINSQGKSIEVKVLYDILDDFNYKTANITKMILKAIKSQNQPPRSNSDVQPNDLDPREKKIARLIAMGKSNKEIGAALNIAEGSAKVLVAALQKKLGLEGREQIAVYAALNNLLGDGDGDNSIHNEMKEKSS